MQRLLPICARLNWPKARYFVRSLLAMHQDFQFSTVLNAAITTIEQVVSKEDLPWLLELYRDIDIQYQDWVIHHETESNGNTSKGYIQASYNILALLEKLECNESVGRGLNRAIPRAQLYSIRSNYRHFAQHRVISKVGGKQIKDLNKRYKKDALLGPFHSKPSSLI